MCKKAGTAHLSKVKESLPIMIGLLSREDKSLVKNATLGLASLIDNFRSHSEGLSMLAEAKVASQLLA